MPLVGWSLLAQSNTGLNFSTNCYRGPQAE
jgi:hypothetical protein